MPSYKKFFQGVRNLQSGHNYCDRRTDRQPWQKQFVSLKILRETYFNLNRYCLLSISQTKAKSIQSQVMSPCKVRTPKLGWDRMKTVQLREGSSLWSQIQSKASYIASLVRNQIKNVWLRERILLGPSPWFHNTCILRQSYNKGNHSLKLKILLIKWNSTFFF